MISIFPSRYSSPSDDAAGKVEKSPRSYARWGAIKPLGFFLGNIIEWVTLANVVLMIIDVSSRISVLLHVALSEIDRGRIYKRCAIPRQCPAVKSATRNEWVTKNASLALFHNALVHQIYIYVMCVWMNVLLVKSTSFSPIVRDSNTIIVRYTPSLIASSVQYVVYYPFYMQIRTIAFIANYF